MDNEIQQNISVNEKLKGFTTMALREAYKQKEELIEKTKKENAEKLKQKELELLEDAYHTIQTGTRQNRSELNEAISKALVDGKKKLFEKRKEIINMVFDKVLIRLKEYMKSEDYINYLNDTFKESIDLIGDDEYNLVINKGEAKLFNTISNKVNVKLNITESKVDIIGGFIISGINKRLMADCSFKTRIDESHDKFLELCSLPIEDGDLIKYDTEF